MRIIVSPNIYIKALFISPLFVNTSCPLKPDGCKLSVLLTFSLVKQSEQFFPHFPACCYYADHADKLLNII